MCEVQYNILTADSIHQLSDRVGEALEKNRDDYEQRLFTVKGGPVYDIEKKKWCQAIVCNSWVC